MEDIRIPTPAVPEEEIFEVSHGWVILYHTGVAAQNILRVADGIDNPNHSIYDTIAEYLDRHVYDEETETNIDLYHQQIDRGSLEYLLWQFGLSRSHSVITDKPVQELYRGIILTCCSGLDAVVKQLTFYIKAFYESKQNSALSRHFKSFVKERIGSGNTASIDQLAELLASTNKPQDYLLNEFIEMSKKRSYQSADALLRIGSYFEMDSSSVCKDIPLLKKVFEARNMITHEMDMVDAENDITYKFARIQRERSTVISYANLVLEVAGNLLDGIILNEFWKPPSKKDKAKGTSE